MPSVAGTIMKIQLRLAKPLVRFTSIEASRAGQDGLGRVTTRLLKGRVTYHDVPFDRFSACFAKPNDMASADGYAILYLHGGGYTAGSLDYAKGFGGVLAAETHVNTLCVAYRLAPENPYPAALDDALEAYSFLLESGYAPEKIAFAGESAGGGLIYCLAHACRARGVPLPSCMVGISPWTDLTLSGGSYRNNVMRDPTLVLESLAYYALAYAAGHERDAFVSPIYGSLTDFPPSMIFAGSDEILLDDSRTLVRKLIEGGSHVDFTIERGMWHVYPLYGTPEGRTAVTKMSRFIRERLGLPAAAENLAPDGVQAPAEP